VTVEVPSDTSRTRRIAMAVAAVVIGTALLAFGVWAATQPVNRGPKQTRIDPAEQTAEPTSAPLPGATPATSTAEATEGAPPDATPPPEPAPDVAATDQRIAFVLGSRIHVAEQDGSGAIGVAPLAQAYSLSPDGATLAVVYTPSDGQGNAGTVSLFDTASGAMRSVGSGAVAVAPVWAPDSSWLAYTSESGFLEVHRVAVTGGAPSPVARPGSGPRVSRDGSLIAYAESDEVGASDSLRVISSGGGKSVEVGGAEMAQSWGWGASNALFFTRPREAEGVWELWRAEPPAFRGKRVGSITLEPPAFALDDVIVSPNGSAVLLSAMGDDAYSRLLVADVASGRVKAIPTRRDAYPLRWSADGRVMYFEGNSYQGESSMLATVLPDGTSKVPVVTGAQR
jgi:hypothetical protein